MAQFREKADHGCIHAIGRGSRGKTVVVKARCGGDVERTHIVAKSCTQEVRFVHHVHINPVCGHARKLPIGVGRVLFNGERVGLALSLQGAENQCG